MIAAVLAFALAAQAATSAAPALSADEQELKATYEAWITAWNTADLKTIGDIASGTFGFGRDVPFPRPPAASADSYQRGLQSYFNIMDDVSYESNSTNYKVVGSTGMVWGYYAQTTKQKSGPSRTVYGRQSLTFVKQGGKWRLLLYHRSAFPSEFVR